MEVIDLRTLVPMDTDTIIASVAKTGRAVIVPELEADELQAIIDAWTDGVYHVREHSGIRTTPMRRWMSSPVPPRAAPAG